MSGEIQQFVGFSDSQVSEQLVMNIVPKSPFRKVVADILTLSKQNYLVTVGSLRVTTSKQQLPMMS